MLKDHRRYEQRFRSAAETCRVGNVKAKINPGRRLVTNDGRDTPKPYAIAVGMTAAACLGFDRMNLQPTGQPCPGLPKVTCRQS